MENPDFFLDEYIDTLGLESPLKRDPGVHRGLTPRLNESQNKAWDSLSSKLYHRGQQRTSLISRIGITSGVSSDADQQDDDDEEEIEFDITSTKHAILHDGKILKRSLHAVVTHVSRRYMFLLNDAILLTTQTSSSSTAMGIKRGSDRFQINQVLRLDRIAILDVALCEESNKNSFEIIAPTRAYSLSVDSESDKRVWMEELELAIFAVHAVSPYSKIPGWQHEVVRGTIHSIALYGDADAMAVYIARLNGESPDIPDSSGMCPIHWAAIRGHLEVTNMLLDAGSEVEVLNSGLNSPLLLAASRGQDTVLQTLIESGADVFLHNLKDRDALFMAVLYGNRTKGFVNVLNILNFKGVDLNRFDSSGSAPLHECALRNLARPIRLLVEAGADVNLMDNRSHLTPIQLAAASERPDAETVRAFIAAGAHLNIRDSDSMTPFSSVLKNYQAAAEQCEVEDKSRNSSRASVPVPSTHALKEGFSSMAIREFDEIESDTSKAVMTIGTVIQTFLPILTELAKGGAKFEVSELGRVRESVKNAILSGKQYWTSLEQPDYFLEFSHARVLKIAKDEWVSDSSSNRCHLCNWKFNYSHRRHHCRSCGILCCGSCSSKKLILNVKKKKSKLPPTPTNGALVEGDRVCDSCFNKLLCEAKDRQDAVRRARAAAERMAAEGVEDGANLGPSSQQAALTQSTLEVLDELNKRGELLAAAAEKSEKLESGATEFNRMTRELLRKQQRRSAW